jgi:lipid-A-disaccharide synthase
VPARSPRVFLSAGEPSGDLHGGPVVRELLAQLPGIAIDALGGARVAAAGATVRFPMEKYSAFGFVEVLGSIPAHLRLLRTLTRDFRAGVYDLALLIDYPGFNVRVAEAAHRHGVRVLYYVAPQLWAWRPGRAHRLAKAVDRLAAVLPFEPAFFARHGIRAEYVGHPLLDRPPLPGGREARKALGIGPEERVLGLFPGSRAQEMRRLWEPFREAATRLLQARRCDRVVVGLHPVTSFMARRLITVPWISLVNLVAEGPVVEELTQGGATPDRLADAVAPLLDPANEKTRLQRDGLRLVRERLDGGGAAGRVAGMAAELLG